MTERDAETEARSVLQAFVPRLGDAPHALLGVAADATSEVLRAAFLRLTKQYHPTRYARFAPDVVRMANEVFLTIKRAYDQLTTSNTRATARGTGSVAQRPAGSTPPPERVPTTSAPPPGRAPTVTASPSPPRAVTPTPAPRTATTPRSRMATPAIGLAKPPAAPVPATGTPRVTFAAPDPAAPPTRSRPPSGPPPRPALTPVEEAMEPAMELMRRKLWADARQALMKLAVALPQEKKYRAYMHYARGRESQDAGKLDEARAELQRALALEPELAVAKRVLEDLPVDPGGGGLFGRLFKK